MEYGLAIHASWKKPILKIFYRWTFEEIQKFAQKIVRFW